MLVPRWKHLLYLFWIFIGIQMDKVMSSGFEPLLIIHYRLLRR
ncbi:hypothetical protein B4088_1528 [Bacillus cereus]|uniref:Uncharacterized protein n=1 Tax=Bacillus cereus TaxID=1396 RepID=A0A164Q455_BACCE|nr:hypothetical protein B4088_1528 [Bacillus cereus]